MSDELLLPIYYNDETCLNKSMAIHLFKLTFLHTIFIIGDIYFSINNCNSPDAIMNVTAYFALYATIEFIWVMYYLDLIIKKKDIVLNYNCDAYIFMIYNVFVVLWNMLGIFMLSDLLDYPCDDELYNYLFAKIIINYFYCVYKIFAICYE
jgi:hypothetical protein